MASLTCGAVKGLLFIISIFLDSMEIFARRFAVLFFSIKMNKAEIPINTVSEAAIR